MRCNNWQSDLQDGIRRRRDDEPRFAPVAFPSKEPPGSSFSRDPYDAQNQLIRIDHPDATVTTYAYDALGRRIEKDVAGITTRYVYDRVAILVEYDGTNLLQARYSHGNNIDQPLAVERGGSVAYYQTDHLGSVRQLTNVAGTVVNSYDYDSYGRVESAVEAIAQPYRFTAREYDSESGNYYYRARYYDPATGRFLAEDPIGFAAGDANLYRYVLSNPVNLTDPSGQLAFAAPAIPPILTALGKATAYVGSAIAVALGLDYLLDETSSNSSTNEGENAGDESDSDSDTCEASDDEPCPPCRLIDGTIVPLGTIAYRWDRLPITKKQHGIYGDHLNLFRANQNPNNCQCFWQPIGAVPPPPKPGWIPVRHFAN